MSNNLHCELGGMEINLLQTPSQITNMCMVQINGNIQSTLSGDKAKHALQIYCQWVLGKSNGVYKNKEEADWARKMANEEVDKIQDLFKSKKTLEVYIM